MGSGFRTFQSGEVLTASNVQNFLMEQSVMVFAGTAALGSAIGTAVEAGMVAYLTDADQLIHYVADAAQGTAWQALPMNGAPRNVIINGAMQVAQRGTSTTGITANGYYTADRWNTQITTLGTWTQAVENDAPTGSGFRKSLKMLISAGAESPIGGANDLCLVEQVFEGQNLQQFLKGTSSAKQFSLSFWVKSNVTGTYIVRFNDADNTRTVAASYTISASATWEKKTITFPADTTGAFDNDNAASLRMQFWLAAGSSFTSGTLATTWQSTTNANLAVGQTNLAAATNNYWQITGIQLEAGAVATPFEFEDYGTTLAKCQRYYYLHVSGNSKTIGVGYYLSGTQAETVIQFPVTMRTAPSGVVASGTNFYVMESNATFDQFNLLEVARAGDNSLLLYAASDISGTEYRALRMATNNASASIALSAEL